MANIMTLAELVVGGAALIAKGISPSAEVVIVYDSETCYSDAIRIEVCNGTVGIIGGVKEPAIGTSISYESGLSDEDKLIQFAVKQQAETVRQLIRERIDKSVVSNG